MHASTQQPWLNYIYIFSPGHTPRTYTGTEQELIDYREEFTEKQKKTAQYIQMLIDHINTNDPTGIVVIFGDHGPGFSRGMNMNSENADFVIKDFHGVLSAVYPGDTCSSYLGKRDEKEFITPSKLVRQLITCLANGDDPIDWDVDYSGPYKDYKFEDFLYE
jgi:membrane-anchored protein YejM (alkaline phosphatase superfamily)